MRVLVCGGRTYADADEVARVLGEHSIDVLCHGGARGADTLAGEWAAANRVVCEVFYANWRKHGRGAGPIRNLRMLNEFKPDLVIAFPGGRGTAHMVGMARDAGIETITLVGTIERTEQQ